NATLLFHLGDGRRKPGVYRHGPDRRRGFEMILDQFRLDGQTALVTGCRRGIGMALAEALAEAGADIIGVSASLKESGEEVAQRVAKLGRKFTGFKCDLSNRQSLYDFIQKITGTPIDIVINNAGTIRRAPAAQYS